MPKVSLALALALALSLALPLAAQQHRELPGHGPDGPDKVIQAATKSKVVPHKLCPKKISLDIAASYPQGTGNAEVDKFFEDLAEEFIQQTAEDNQDDVLTKDFACQYRAHLYASLGFEATQPNPDILGVLVTIDQFLGGNHPSLDFQAYNFNLKTGKEVTVADLFADPKAGIAKIYTVAYKELCHKTPKHEAAWTVLGGKCGSDTTAPAATLDITGSLNQLGHMTLTEHGALLTFQPYEIWSWSQGPFELPISKDDLVAMGAQDFWGAGKTGQ
jgi:hypothetical protein